MTGTDEAKGPKVDIPEELADELSASGDDEQDGTRPRLDIEVDDASESKADEAEDPADELAQLNDKYLRLAAEFDNFRRRTLRERQELLNYATENLIKDLLTTVDNFERALTHAKQEGEVDRENMLEGLELTYRSLIGVLEKVGLKAVEAEGAVFDPQVHEAIQQIPAADHEPGTVVEVFQKGYLLKDRLLRPALVVVAGPGEKASG